ncbi:MAG: 2-iminoacetate synthase ThiH [Planctomycetota bacterium]|jgi:2-iminoacetate synthase|nr:2-iminoacetate synthase ThiH [Planctomycetota bacterium]
MNQTTCAAANVTAYHSRLVLDALETAGLVLDRGMWEEKLASITPERVLAELSRPARYHPDRMAVLLSPVAGRFLEKMAMEAVRLTRRRFGNAISLFAPLYLSNYCANRCRYCGFNSSRTHHRRRLSLDEAMNEASILAADGFRDILLVSGEDIANINVDYLSRLARRLLDDLGFAGISVEISIQGEEDYRRLFEAGIDGVTIFQETYGRDAYAAWHPTGPKSVFANRIMASEAAARAGMRRIGLGVLLGLEDWRLDGLAMAAHADVLSRHYWRSRTSFSFPRVRPAESGHEGQFFHHLSDADLTQMILALRLCFPDSGLTLSTRESPKLRDNLIPLGITQISAGSRVNPGGYGETAGETSSTGQFEVADERSAAEIADALRGMGFDPVWKDWDSGFTCGRAGGAA